MTPLLRTISGLLLLTCLSPELRAQTMVDSIGVQTRPTDAPQVASPPATYALPGTNATSGSILGTVVVRRRGNPFLTSSCRRWARRWQR